MKGRLARGLVCDKWGVSEAPRVAPREPGCVALSFVAGSPRSLLQAAPRCPGVSSRGPAGPGPLLTAPVSPPSGHNADDMAETVLMNFLRGDAGRLARGGGLGSPGVGLTQRKRKRNI